MESTQENSTLSRAQLFDLVWTEPMRKLAPRLGLSDVGLAKICRKHGVPTPPVGYWTRVAHGIHDERPELPDLDDEDHAEIMLFRHRFKQDQGDEPNRVKEERKIVVQVSEQLHRPHRSVQKAKELLAKQKPDEVGLLQTDETCLKLSVSKATLSRALRILNAVIEAWEQEGGSVTASSFGLNKNSVQVKLSEQVKRLVDESGKNAYWNRYKYKKTGKLVLEIKSVGGAGLRKTWADGKVQRLEDKLGNFIKTLHQWMNSLEEHRLDEECRARQRQAAADRRRHVQEKQEAEQKRRDHLHALVEQWQKAKSVQSFLEALERACNRDDDQRIEVSSEWLDWIRWYADYLCPLTKTPARDEFIERPENTEIGELHFTKETSEYMKHAPYRDTNELHAAGHDTVARLFGHHSWSAMREVRDVLEGLGYDVRNYGHAFY